LLLCMYSLHEQMTDGDVREYHKIACARTARPGGAAGWPIR
jgi:hypothetical protein